MRGVLSDDILRRVAGQFRETLIDAKYLAILVGDHDAIVCIKGHGGKTQVFFRCPQLLIGFWSIPSSVQQHDIPDVSFIS